MSASYSNPTDANVVASIEISRLLFLGFARKLTFDVVGIMLPSNSISAEVCFIVLRIRSAVLVPPSRSCG